MTTSQLSHRLHFKFQQTTLIYSLADQVAPHVMIGAIGAICFAL